MPQTKKKKKRKKRMKGSGHNLILLSSHLRHPRKKIVFLTQN